jgi:hypothetical protein
MFGIANPSWNQLEAEKTPHKFMRRATKLIFGLPNSFQRTGRPSLMQWTSGESSQSISLPMRELRSFLLPT